jgi:hypothetical protein
MSGALFRRPDTQGQLRHEVDTELMSPMATVSKAATSGVAQSAGIARGGSVHLPAGSRRPEPADTGADCGSNARSQARVGPFSGRQVQRDLIAAIGSASPCRSCRTGVVGYYRAADVAVWPAPGPPRCSTAACGCRLSSATRCARPRGSKVTGPYALNDPVSLGVCSCGLLDPARRRSLGKWVRRMVEQFSWDSLVRRRIRTTSGLSAPPGDAAVIHGALRWQPGSQATTLSG